MKRFLCAMLIAFMVLMVSGCGRYNKSGSTDNWSDNNGRMTCIYNDGFALVWRDNETGVQYLRVGSGVTALLNPDGTPYTGEWEGDK